MPGMSIRRAGQASLFVPPEAKIASQDATIHEGEALMAISLYSGFVPVCLQLLGGLKTVLQKAEEHTTAQKWDTATVLNLRLYPDMFTLERQVRQVCNHALGAGRVRQMRRRGTVLVVVYFKPAFRKSSCVRL